MKFRRATDAINYQLVIEDTDTKPEPLRPDTVPYGAIVETTYGALLFKCRGINSDQEVFVCLRVGKDVHLSEAARNPPVPFFVPRGTVQALSFFRLVPNPRLMLEPV